MRKKDRSRFGGILIALSVVFSVIKAMFREVRFTLA